MSNPPDLRAAARQLFDAAVAAADPVKAVLRGLDAHPVPDAGRNGRTLLIAIGKAAPAMLRAAQTRFPGAAIALAVTHHENPANLTGAEILHAGHPVPDAAGARAAERVIEVLQDAGPEDRVIALISGGGSALLPAPPEGVSLADKAALNALLLSAGLDIVQMNMIRQQVSRLKGGGFVRLAAPAPVYAYLLSDVIGDDLRAIASGPTVGPIGTAETAIDTLKTAQLWDRVPASIRHHLTSVTPPDTAIAARNTLVGSNRLSLEAMKKVAQDIGFSTEIVSDALTGDVQEAADRIVSAVLNVTAPTALLFGGETTVRLRGTGRGGRNQELALRVARQMPRSDHAWVFLSGGTDGRDGPTDAAGGIVDAGTLNRIRKAGEDAETLLCNNDSYRALQAAGDLLVTGATGTNVADVQALLIAP